MAELKRTFSAGVMNKDLDERLLPSGQYRDALNVQVSTSEGSDVGALQNILGNKLPYAASIAANLGENAVCIGSIRRDETECVYWFVQSSTKSLVIEYNQTENQVVPVLVDTNSVLGFTRENLITGVEILDDFLIWTDNVTEPKIIKISDWRDTFANGSWNHTQVGGGDFQEKHCTVIKEAPKTPLALKMFKTTRSGPISATLTDRPTFGNESGGYSFTYNDPVSKRWEPVATGPYTDQNGDGVDDVDYLGTSPVPDARQSQILISGTAPDFRVGDKLKITLINKAGEDEDVEAEVIVSVTRVYPANPKLFKINIDSVSENIEQGEQNWKIELIQKPAMFPTKFVRFAYRWKYKDGEYSTISPFSETAFIGDTFDYEYSKGYNLGMVNQLRKLEIRNFSPSSLTGMYAPYNVAEVDILYKDSVSNNIYVVKSIKTTDPEYTDIGSSLDAYSGRLEIESELIYKVIPSNQILRPYDNVPKRAKALSVSGNRLMFGNYTENYDMVDQGRDITVKFAINVYSDNYPVKTALPSVKSQRTYQVGVSYRDKYGRETPVFTDQTGSFTLNKGFAESRNSITARVTSPIPSWADSFKYYVKETSQPYYNIAMDRYYPAEDGNVWVSFSSSDRNKIQEDTFVELKKKHDSDEFVGVEAKYKVLAIENEVPDFVKDENVSKGIISRDIVSGINGVSGTIFGTTTGYPTSLNSFVDIKADDWQKIFGGAGDEVTSSTPVHQLNNLNLIMFNSDNSTKRYEITNIQYFAHYSPAVYRVNLTNPFDSDDVQFFKTPPQENNAPSISIEVFQKESKNKPEYQGRFFTKLQRDSVLEDAIILDTTSKSNLLIKASQSFFCMPATLQPNNLSFWSNMVNKLKAEDNTTPGWFIDRNTYWRVAKSDGPANNYQGGKRDTWQRWGAGVGNKYMDISWHHVGNGTGRTGTIDAAVVEMERFGRNNFDAKEYHPDQTTMYKGLTKVGTKFRFEGDPNKEENVYTIVSYVRSYIIPYRRHNKDWKNGQDAQNRVINIGLLLDKEIKWSPEGKGFDYDGSGKKPNKSLIQIVEQSFEEKDNNVTDNPAVFETEPKEAAELDIYYEASQAFGRGEHGSAPRLAYKNCYSFGNGVESDRIRDDFNAPTLGKGVKVSTVIKDQYKEVTKKSDIIFSGIYNSTSSTNNLNQFIQAEQITKSINPSYGSIQLMQFRLGKLDVYMEDNVVSILSDKDALFNADGSRNVVASTNVLGSIQPYAGDFGISKNPESYARYGNRAYFSDKNRGVILRLSGNGLESISRYGLEDYFRDKLSVSSAKVIGSYDENKKEYNITFVGSTLSKDTNGELVDLSKYNDTTSFKESTNGWNTRKSFIQENGVSLNNTYYSFGNGEIWSHNNEVRNNFYGQQYESSVKFIFNNAPGSVKSFKTLNYEGSQARIFVDNPDSDNKFENRLAKPGWWVESIESDLQSGQVKTFKNKEGKWFYNILGTETTAVNLDTREYSVQGLGLITAVQGAQGQEVEIIVE
tara:strand:+ start:7524 stop:12026 length:4503 start_codon:yes stop_codon:yes gene_type:complete